MMDRSQHEKGEARNSRWKVLLAVWAGLPAGLAGSVALVWFALPDPQSTELQRLLMMAGFLVTLGSAIGFGWGGYIVLKKFGVVPPEWVSPMPTRHQVGGLLYMCSITVGVFLIVGQFFLLGTRVNNIDGGQLVTYSIEWLLAASGIAAFLVFARWRGVL